MNTIRRTIRAELRGAESSGSDRSMFAVLSTPGVKADNINVLGWEQPLPDSVPLIDTHLDGEGVSAVVGRCYPRMDDDRLVGRLTFASGDINPRAEPAFQLCANGFVDAVSVSFRPIDWSFANDRLPRGMDIAVARLLEVSVCAVPVDDDAKISPRALGLALSAQARGAATSRQLEVIARAVRTREQALHRAASGGKGQTLSEFEESVYKRYMELRACGFDAETVAREFFIPAHQVRAIVARALST